VAGGAGLRSAAGHAAKAGTNTSGAGGLYPSDACGLTIAAAKPPAPDPMLIKSNSSSHFVMSASCA